MQIGFHLTPFWSPTDRTPTQIIDEAVEVVRAASAMGYAWVSMGHHWLSHPTVWPQPYPLIARLAPETGSMQLKTSVLLLPLLNPVEVAENVATLDHITHGRLLLGVAIGYREKELETVGLGRKDRAPKLEESIHLLKQLWSGEEVTFQGKYAKVTKGRMGFTPYQKPHPPIEMGAQSEGATKRAARISDGVFFGPQVAWGDIRKLADVYRQRVQAGNDELAVIQAQSNYESSKADLIAYLGVEYDEKAWIIDVSQAPTDIDTTEFGELNHRYDNFDNLVATGVEQRPDHQATGEALNAASSSVTIARAGHLPTVSAGGSYGYSNPKLDKLTDNRSLSLNLSVSLPIFNGFGTSNAVEQARIQEMNAREDMEQSKRQIAVDVRKALLNLEQAEKRLIVTKTSVFSAEMDRKIAEEKYNLGAGTLLDMLVATANYTNAVSGKVNSIFDFLLAKKSMEYALGSITQ